MFKRQILTDCMNPTNKLTGIRWTGLLGTSRKARIISASAIFLAVCAFGTAAVAPAPDTSDIPQVSVAQDLELPNLADQIAALQDDEQQFVREERARAGDTFSALLNRLGVDDADAVKFIKSDKVARGVMQLKSGKRVQARTGQNGELLWLRTTVLDGRDVPVKNISITRKGDRFTAEVSPVKLERRIEMRAREINSSLYAATDSDADGSKLPDTIVAQIIEMFSTNIDFRTDLKRGDRFNVVYETFWEDGVMVRTGRILAGEFTNRGVTYQSVWFEDPKSKQGGGYYSLDGKSLKKAFLKSPLPFSRISSGFSMRSHPISGVWKAHKGVDYAAGTGTPIRAVGDGVIAFAGKKGGYGNFIQIKHWASYSTAYAHMSRFAPGIRNGSKVSQGDIIGYVGSTGWSTGPHLHYEFRVNNEARDPRKIALIQQAPLNAAEKARFRMAAADMAHRFALLRPAEAGTAMAAR
jgi:murein DD-endopeptidase MepM/ murein hydrolase activator NlpD